MLWRLPGKAADCKDKFRLYRVPEGKIPAHRIYTQIGREGKNILGGDGDRLTWQRAPPPWGQPELLVAPPNFIPAPSSTPQFPPTFPSSSRGAFEPAGITPCQKQGISCPLSLCPGKASPHPLPPQCSPSRTDPSPKSTKGETRQRGTNTWLLNIIGFYYTFLLTH